MTQSLQGFFGAGGKGKYAKFEKLGDKIKGKILAIHPPEDSTDPKGNVKRDKNGRAMQQVRIDLETDLRNPEIEFDDGVRTVYVQSYMKDAIGKALQVANVKEPAIGADLEIVLSELEPNPGLNPSKKYTAVYTPASGTSTSSFFSGNIANSTPTAAVKPENFAQADWDRLPEAARRTIADAYKDMPPF